MSMVGRQIIDTAQSYGLSVVPLFILMGLFVNKGGMARELYAVSNAFLGHMRGGIAMATVAACGGFSAICGSSLATAATMSKVAMPQMRRYGYSDGLSTASIAAGGTLGILIPPSVILVIYGLLTETSIGKLFMAGIIPGAWVSCSTSSRCASPSGATRRRPGRANAVQLARTAGRAALGLGGAAAVHPGDRRAVRDLRCPPRST